MANASKSENIEFRVLLYHKGQHSLWPVCYDVQPRWAGNDAAGLRQECLDWAGANLADIRRRQGGAALVGNDRHP